MFRKIIPLALALTVCGVTTLYGVQPVSADESSAAVEKNEKEERWWKKRTKNALDRFEVRGEPQPEIEPEAEDVVEPGYEPEADYTTLPVDDVPSLSSWDENEWDYSPEALDSLLMHLHSYKTVAAFEEFFNDFIQLDTTKVLTSSTPDSVYQARLRAILSPIGLPWNEIVKQFVISYTTNRRNTVSAVLSRSQYYFPIIEEELANAGMPLELRMLPVVESALSPTARSRAGATGLWQFMYGTGKSYGLEITTFVDQRCDPEASTKAACRYLSDLYKMYGDWTLALAAYNCGPGNVNKAFKRAGGDAKNYWDIYPYLPTETRNYVPSFIAVTYAYNYHKLHDIEIRECPMPLATDTIVVKRLMHLDQVASTLDIPLETLRMLNPQYRQDIIPALDKPYPLVLPQNGIARYIDRQEVICAKDSLYLAEYLNPANIDQTRAILTASATTHKVKNGETLGSIAGKYNVTVKQIIRWNNLKNPNKLKIGQRLEIHK